MKRFTLTTFAIALGLTCAIGAYGQSDDKDSLTVGDKAPEIDIAHWLKLDESLDKPITSFKKGNVYVLEFWATWCGPCVGSMPHLSKLQEQYRDYDVNIIGVSDESLPTVVNFLFETYKGDDKLQNERTDYTLTTDPDKSVYNDYFKAAGLRGIPSAFIIGKEGEVEWIGHPSAMDEPLEKIVRGNWDRSEHQKQMQQQQTAQKRQQEAMDRAGDHFDRYQKAVDNQNWDEAAKALGKIAESDESLIHYRFNQFMVLATKARDYDNAYDVAEMFIDSYWDDAAALNQIAWTIVDSDDIQQRNTKVAMRAAKRANKLTDGADAAILDTVARVYYEDGNLNKSIKWQKRAVEHADAGQMGDQLRETLEKYESEKRM